MALIFCKEHMYSTCKRIWLHGDGILAGLPKATRWSADYLLHRFAETNTCIQKDLWSGSIAEPDNLLSNKLLQTGGSTTISSLRRFKVSITLSCCAKTVGNHLA